MSEKAKRPPNPFDFCPKHKGLYKTCGCDYRKGKKESTSSRDNDSEESE